MLQEWNTEKNALKYTIARQTSRLTATKKQMSLYTKQLVTGLVRSKKYMIYSHKETNESIH